MKKILCGIVALIMLFATMIPVTANNITLIAEDYEATPAISVLKSLGIVIGDEKGNLNLDKDITRAEFSTILLRLMGVSNAANTQTATVFEDVPSSHWASGVINYCYNSKIILGYGDNKFGPDDELTFEQAVKMIVCALGYEEMATSKGTYPAGYLTVATDIGLLENCNNSNARMNIFTMCYNALDIPVMEQTGFGTDVKYEIMNKNNDHDKVTLLTKQNIYKLGGIVAANTKVAFKTDATVTDKGFVEFWWDDDFDSPVAAWAKKSKNEPNYANSGIYYGSEILEIGNTNIEETIGNQIIVYVKKNVTKYAVLAYEVDTTSSSMTLTASSLDDNELCFTDTPAYIKYYKTEGASKSTKISFDNNYTVLWNNVTKNADYLATNLNSEKTAIIEFIDFNDNGKYDVVKVIAYDYAIVDEVMASRGYINDLNGNRINLDVENEDAKVSITDIKGNSLDITDIKKNDVLAMIVNTNLTSVQMSLRNASYDSLDIIVLNDAYVVGSVDGKISDDEYTINGKEYKVSDNAYNKSKIDLSAEGTFWVDMYDETIIGFEGDIVKSGSYAYIIGAYWNNNKDQINKIVTLEVVTKDGYCEYKVADDVKFILPDGKVKSKAEENMPALDDTVWAGEFDNTVTGEALYNKFNNSTPAPTSEDTILRTVKISTNSANEIIEITPAKLTTKDNVPFNYTDVNEKLYDADDYKLGTKFLYKNATVIKVDFVDPEKTKFTNISYFVDENEYSALFLDADANNNYSAAIVYDSSAIYAEGNGVAIVQSVITTKNDEGDEVIKVSAVKDSEKIELIFDENSIKGYNSTTEYEDLQVGSVFMYVADGQGLVDTYDVIGNIEYDGGNKTFVFDAGFAANANADFEDGDAYFLGYIVNITNNNIQIGLTDSIVDNYNSIVDEFVTKDDKSMDVLNLSVKGANQYALTGRNKANTKIEIGDYRIGNITEICEAEENEYEVYYVFIRTYEGKVVDIMGLDTTTPNIIPNPFN